MQDADGVPKDGHRHTGGRDIPGWAVPQVRAAIELLAGSEHRGLATAHRSTAVGRGDGAAGATARRMIGHLVKMSAARVGQQELAGVVAADHGQRAGDDGQRVGLVVGELEGAVQAGLEVLAPGLGL